MTELPTRQEHRSDAVSLIIKDIRQRILLQQFQPGEHLREIQLAGQYQVSRSTLRTALQALEGEGLILTQVNGSRIVLPFTAQSAEDIYLVREMLEQQAIELIFHRLPVNYTPLVQVLDQIAAVVRDRQDVRREVCISLDMAFHRALFVVAESWALLRCWDTLAPIMDALLNLNTTDAYQVDYVQDFYAKHKQICDGVVTRSPELVSQMAVHIRDARSISLQQLAVYRRVLS